MGTGILEYGVSDWSSKSTISRDIQTDYDYTITFDGTEPKGWAWTNNAEPKSVTYEMLPIMQADGAVIKKMAKVLHYDNMTLCFTDFVSDECICETLI